MMLRVLISPIAIVDCFLKKTRVFVSFSFPYLHEYDCCGFARSNNYLQESTECYIRVRKSRYFILVSTCAIKY